MVGGEASRAIHLRAQLLEEFSTMAWPVIELKGTGVSVWPAWSRVQHPDLCAGRDLNCLAENRVEKANCAESSHFQSKQHFFHCCLIQMAIEMLWSEGTLCPCLHSRADPKPSRESNEVHKSVSTCWRRAQIRSAAWLQGATSYPLSGTGCSSELWKEKWQKCCHICCDTGVSCLSDYMTGCIQGL